MIFHSLPCTDHVCCTDFQIIMWLPEWSFTMSVFLGLPFSSAGKQPAQCRRYSVEMWGQSLGPRTPGEGKWLPIPVFLSEKLVDRNRVLPGATKGRSWLSMILLYYFSTWNQSLFFPSWFDEILLIFRV